MRERQSGQGGQCAGLEDDVKPFVTAPGATAITVSCRGWIKLPRSARSGAQARDARRQRSGIRTPSSEQVLPPRFVSLPWMIKKSLSLLAVAGLLAALWWYQGRNAAVAEAEAGTRQDQVAQAMAVSAAALASPTAVGRAHHPEFEHTPDLYAYAQRLRVAANAGDAQALWLLSKVYDYCVAYAEDAAAYESDTRRFAAVATAQARTMAAARLQVGQRCARFSPDDGLSHSLIAATRAQAARAGNLAAEAALLSMGEPIEDASAYKRDLVERVQRSRDPDAYLAIAPAMGIAASGGQSYFGPVSGTGLAELAWQLAACRLGAACEANGSLMVAHCANGGICSRDASQDFRTFVLDAGVPRQSTERLDQMVDGLVADKEGRQ